MAARWTQRQRGQALLTLAAQAAGLLRQRSKALPKLQVQALFSPQGCSVAIVAITHSVHREVDPLASPALAVGCAVQEPDVLQEGEPRRRVDPTREDYKALYLMGRYDCT